MTPKTNKTRKEKEHKHYWETTGDIAREYSSNTASTSPMFREFVITICHECGVVRKKYL